MAIIRDDCWEAGCHGTAEARLHTPKMSQFSRLYNNHSKERHKHEKGERSRTLLTGISAQSKVRGSRLSRKVHTDMG